MAMDLRVIIYDVSITQVYARCNEIKRKGAIIIAKINGSMMGTSKYEFNPEQFDIDMAEHQRRYAERKSQYTEQLRKLIESEPHRMNENYSLIIEVLREIREDYK